MTLLGIDVGKFLSENYTSFAVSGITGFLGAMLYLYTRTIKIQTALPYIEKGIDKLDIISKELEAQVHKCNKDLSNLSESLLKIRDHQNKIISEMKKKKINSKKITSLLEDINLSLNRLKTPQNKS